VVISESEAQARSARAPRGSSRERTSRRGHFVYLLGLLAAVALFGSGLTVAYLGYAETAGPDGAVRGYYAALARSDAADALAFGPVPKGVHVLLTGAVLAEQQRLAPIRGFSVVSAARHGDRATVRVRYTLAFPGHPQQQTDDVRVRRRDGTWRLVRTALATTLYLPSALQRATIVGAGIPEGTVLMFPGAVPIRFDSPYLELDPATAAVSFASPASTEVTARVSDAGRTAVAGALVKMLGRCLTAGPRAGANCPAPASNYVPGSLRGTLVGAIEPHLIIDLEPNAIGRIDVSGQVRIHGRYRWLTFTNQPRVKSGRVNLPVVAHGYAVRPFRLVWGAS
jgi:hypothetical protein